MRLVLPINFFSDSHDESVTQRDRSDTDSPLLWVCPVKDEDPEPQPKHWPFCPARNKTQLSQTVPTVTATLSAALEELCLTPTYSWEAVRESRKSFCPPFIDSRTACLRSAAFRRISSLIRSAFFHSTWARASASTSMWSRSFLCLSCTSCLTVAMRKRSRHSVWAEHLTYFKSAWFNILLHYAKTSNWLTLYLMALLILYGNLMHYASKWFLNNIWVPSALYWPVYNIKVVFPDNGIV